MQSRLAGGAVLFLLYASSVFSEETPKPVTDDKVDGFIQACEAARKAEIERLEMLLKRQGKQASKKELIEARKSIQSLKKGRFTLCAYNFVTAQKGHDWQAPR